MKREKRKTLFVIRPRKSRSPHKLKTRRAIHVRKGPRHAARKGAKPRRARNPGSGVRIVYNKLLGGWFVVRGPHQTPLNGRFDSKAAAQAWLNAPRRNPIKGRGKFEGETYAARYAYDNPDAQIGSSDELGWFGYFSGKIKGRGPFHIIVRENSDGFVYGTFYDKLADLDREWSRIENRYEKFYDESGE